MDLEQKVISELKDFDHSFNRNFYKQMIDCGVNIRSVYVPDKYDDSVGQLDFFDWSTPTVVIAKITVRVRLNWLTVTDVYLKLWLLFPDKRGRPRIYKRGKDGKFNFKRIGELIVQHAKTLENSERHHRP